MSFTIENLRRSHLHYQQLLGTVEDISVSSLVDRIGYIQIDSISVIARSHHLVPHARSYSYTEGKVWDLLEDGRFFEGAAHARCLLPVDDFDYYYTQMLQRRDNRPKWLDQNTAKVILEYIRDNGPVTIDEIDVEPELRTSTGWGSMLKRVVDYLSYRGYILTCGRENFQVVVDMAERVVDIPTEPPSPLESFWFMVNRSLRANGPSMLDRLLHYNKNHSRFVHDSSELRPRKLIKQAARTGRLVEIDVQDYKYTFYALPHQVEVLDDLPEPDSTVRLLSPFDNALWSRKDLLRQYGMDYKMEVYVPKKQRKYGYYAMPILYGTEFVGRVDVKLHRRQQYMAYRQWTWEDDFEPNSSFFDELSKTIDRFNHFHRVNTFTMNGIKTKYVGEIVDRSDHTIH